MILSKLFEVSLVEAFDYLIAFSKENDQKDVMDHLSNKRGELLKEGCVRNWYGNGDKLTKVEILLAKNAVNMNDREYFYCCSVLRKVIDSAMHKIHYADDDRFTTRARNIINQLLTGVLPNDTEKLKNQIIITPNALMSIMRNFNEDEMKLLGNDKVVGILGISSYRDLSPSLSGNFLDNLLDLGSGVNEYDLERWYDYDGLDHKVLIRGILQHYVPVDSTCSLNENAIRFCHIVIGLSSMKSCSVTLLAVLDFFDAVDAWHKEKSPPSGLDWIAHKKAEVDYMRGILCESPVQESPQSINAYYQFARLLRERSGNEIAFLGTLREINVSVLKRRHVITNRLGDALQRYQPKELGVGGSAVVHSSDCLSLLEILSLNEMDEYVLINNAPDYLKIRLVQYGIVDAYKMLAEQADNAEVVEAIMEIF